LGVGEGRDDLSWWPGDLYPFKRVRLYDTLGDKPGKEDSEAAQVAVDGVAGKAFVLGMVKAVIGETALLLQVKDDPPDFMVSNLGYIDAYTL